MMNVIAYVVVKCDLGWTDGRMEVKSYRNLKSLVNKKITNNEFLKSSETGLYHSCSTFCQIGSSRDDFLKCDLFNRQTRQPNKNHSYSRQTSKIIMSIL
jgi:hypothetical protein